MWWILIIWFWIPVRITHFKTLPCDWAFILQRHKHVFSFLLETALISLSAGLCTVKSNRKPQIKSLGILASGTQEPAYTDIKGTKLLLITEAYSRRGEEGAEIKKEVVLACFVLCRGKGQGFLKWEFLPVSHFPPMCIDSIF